MTNPTATPDATTTDAPAITLPAAGPERDMHIWVAFTTNGRNGRATARECGVSAATVANAVARHVERMDANTPGSADTAPGASVAVRPADDAPATDADAIAGTVVDAPPADDAPADDAPAPDAPADDAPSGRRARKPHAVRCGICGYRFGRSRPRGICRIANACATRVRNTMLNDDDDNGRDHDADAITAAMDGVFAAHAAFNRADAAATR